MRQDTNSHLSPSTIPPTSLTELSDYSIPETFYPSSDKWPQSISSMHEEDTAKIVTGSSSNLRKPKDYHKELPEEPKRRRVCGVSISAFALTVTLGIIAVTGAIGGGVAGILASDECQKDLRDLRRKTGPLVPTATTSARTSPTATGTAAASASVITVPGTGCPNTNGTTHTAMAGDSSADFLRICDAVKIGADMFQISTPSWETCIDACLELRGFISSLETNVSMPQCIGLSYVPEWSLHPEYARGNYSTPGSCWLKNAMGGLKEGRDWQPGTEVVSAVLQE
ncbi:hypothetical protein P154DRAFT_517779 [Amniculicola lignicola CBS 123094]|uniref:Apple domain-containing protein n=1 Tax=Amniculicola lignicola CBS 123094 TaxID=1392246 RepID=A0A6A5WYJ3_9PLEO|nr:hypothetical protein P154DRAFT_517779 [Amniculicola lignicola CBS 123094]